MPRQHVVQPPVNVRALVGAGAAQLDAHGLQPVQHHPAADFAFFDDFLHPFALFAYPALFARRTGAAHQPAGAVDGAVERSPALFAVDALDDHADIAH